MGLDLQCLLVVSCLFRMSRHQTCGTHPNLVRMRYLFIDQLPRLVESINQQRVQWAQRQHAAADRDSQEQLRRDLQTQLAQEELKPTQVFVFAAYELCEGGDLKKLLAKQREARPAAGVSPSWGLPLRHAKMLAFQLLNGLAFLHNEKVRTLNATRVPLHRFELLLHARSKLPFHGRRIALPSAMSARRRCVSLGVCTLQEAPGMSC